MLQTFFFRVLVIPSAVFLSVIFGASYGSGREVAEFVSSHGPTGGLVAISTGAAVYGVVLTLSFELARLFKTYDYVSFIRVLLRRGWFLYEITILVGMIIALSITTTVGGTVLEDHFGIPAWTGILLIFALIVVLTFFGRQIVEESMMFAVAALFAVLAILVYQLVDSHYGRIADAFSTFEHQSGGIATGLKYAVANGGYVPLLLYCAIGLRSRREAFTAGIVAACVAVVPMAVFHFAFMAGYPAIIEERLPTYWMFDEVSTPFMLNAYVVVIFVLISLTGVGLLQGLIERLDAWQKRRTGGGFGRAGHSLIAGAMVVISMLLGSMGVVALILRGYTVMFASFVVVFVVPLITFGAYLVFRKQPNVASS